MMKKILLFLCLLASASAFAQDSTKTEVKFGGKRPGLVFLDGKRYNGDINNIAPATIESISVLGKKDAIAQYGAEGRDGVVIIKTKKLTVGAVGAVPVTDTAKFTPTATFAAEPLYIIDGKKANKATLQILNPSDIESISVFKNQEAIAPYGDEGKNGVIKVTTKASTKKLKDN